jgi:hypothetical protein
MMVAMVAYCIRTFVVADRSIFCYEVTKQVLISKPLRLLVRIGLGSFGNLQVIGLTLSYVNERWILCVSFGFNIIIQIPYRVCGY